MSERSKPSRVRRYAKALAALVILVFVAAACSSDGFPESYSDQPQTNDQGETVSLAEDNWMQGCTVSLDQELAADANTVCQCSYDEISGPDGIPFLEFTELNDNLKSDPTLLQGEGAGVNGTKLVDIIKGCIARG